MNRNLLVRMFCFLLIVLLPAAALCGGTAEVLDITEVDLDPDAKDWSVSDYALPLDLDYESNPEPKADGFTDSKDDNGKPVYTYEDSTIRVVVSETRYYLPNVRDNKGTDIWMADIVITDPSQMRTISAYAKDPFNKSKKGTKKNGLDMASKVHAVTALSGDSWGAGEKGNYWVAVRQGNLVNCNLDNSGKYKMDLLLVDVNGDFHTIHAAQDGDLDNPLEYEGKQIIQAFCFGPVLVENGEAVTEYDGVDRMPSGGGTWIDMNTGKVAQRVAFCQVGPLHYMIVTSATEKGGNRGLTLPEFAEFLASLDIQTAYNLDGGFTTMLYFHGHGKYGKINSRSTDMREIWDIIYFVSAEGFTE